MQKVTKNFINLVKIDSLSGYEGEVCNYLIERLGKMGFRTSVDKYGNLFAKSEGVGRPVLLSAHMDTVSPGKNVQPIVKNNIIKSDGSTILGADNKAAIAAILTAVENVAVKNRRPLEIVFSVREETDGGIKNFDFSKLKSVKGLIADRADKIGTIVLSSPWIVNMEISIKGKATHSGTPEKGRNALTVMCKCISKLNWGRIDKFTTSNIGLINGGSAMNTIPESIQLSGEVRGFDKTRLEEVLSKIKDTFLQISNQSRVKCIFNSHIYCSGYVYTRSDNNVKETSTIFRKLEIKPMYQKSFGGSDANAFIQNGVKIINIGYGAKYTHTTREQISVKSLVDLTRIFQTYIILD